MTHTLPDNLPDSMHPPGPGGLLLDLADTNVGSYLRDFGEGTNGCLARFVGERPTSRICFENQVAVDSIEPHLFREATPEMLDRYNLPGAQEDGCQQSRRHHVNPFELTAYPWSARTVDLARRP
jgi:hypothetical protein